MDYMIVVAIYINDILLVGLFRMAIKMVKKGLKRDYQINDLGSFIIFLKIQMSKISLIKNIYLSQSNYINKILDIFRLEDLSLKDTLMELKLRFTKAKAGKESSNKFRE